VQSSSLPTLSPYTTLFRSIHNARRYLGDRISRTAPPHRILDPSAGPLIGVKLHVLTRKTLGGIQTDLDSRALGASGQPIEGLYRSEEHTSELQSRFDLVCR